MMPRSHRRGAQSLAGPRGIMPIDVRLNERAVNPVRMLPPQYVARHVLPHRSWASFRFRLERFPLLAAGLTSLTVYSSGALWLTALGVGLFAYCFIWYVEALGRELAIVPVIGLVASAQWILGPYMAYQFDSLSLKYIMYVDEWTYMMYAVPAVLAMIVSLACLSRKVDCQALRQFLRSRQSLPPKVIFLMIALGYATDFATPYLPSSILFVAFLLSQLKFVGAIYLLVYRYRYRWPTLIIIFLTTLSVSAKSGMFHDIILWSALILSYVCLELGLRRVTKYFVILGAVVTLMGLQVIKAEYRHMINERPHQAGLVLLGEAMMGLLAGQGRSSVENDLRMVNVRINQGWIISAIMDNVPATTPYENGATIKSAIVDTFIPRVLLDKPAVDMSEKFRKYTGLRTFGKTTFGVSVLGEGWINFGWMGILFMAVWGAWLAATERIVLLISAYHPTFILWLPMLYLQAVKAETEVSVVLNYQTKALFLAFVVYLFIKKFMGVRL
jgi:hypothetical protein